MSRNHGNGHTHRPTMAAVDSFTTKELSVTVRAHNLHRTQAVNRNIWAAVHSQVVVNVVCGINANTMTYARFAMESTTVADLATTTYVAVGNLQLAKSVG